MQEPKTIRTVADHLCDEAMKSLNIDAKAETETVRMFRAGFHHGHEGEAAQAPANGPYASGYERGQAAIIIRSRRTVTDGPHAGQSASLGRDGMANQAWGFGPSTAHADLAALANVRTIQAQQAKQTRQMENA